MKQQFLDGKADTIRLQIYNNNRPVVPTSATITLYKPGSATVLQSSTSATVDANTGEMTYNLTSTHTADTGLNFKADWSYVVSGVTYYQSQLFDIVKSILSIPVVDDDLYDELQALRKEAYQQAGTATAGASGSLTDTLRNESDNFWKGGEIEIIGGTGIGQKRDVTASVQSTGVISVTPTFTTTPDTTTKYRLIKSFNKQIRNCFEKLSTMIYNKGMRQNLILESSQLKVPLVYLTIHFICLDLMTEQNDVWYTRALSYWDRFNESYNGMKLEYDSNESGTIEGQEEQDNPTSIRVGRG